MLSILVNCFIRNTETLIKIVTELCRQLYYVSTNTVGILNLGFVLKPEGNLPDKERQIAMYVIFSAFICEPAASLLLAWGRTKLEHKNPAPNTTGYQKLGIWLAKCIEQLFKQEEQSGSTPLTMA